MLDPMVLSRIQFGANITFHILFPTISIALGWFLFYFKVQFNRTHDSSWNQAYQFWVKIFALTFALGVVSGITMSFQFGTNWPGYMKTIGNIAGPLLAYEVLTAFFLEATFLGVMLFGSKRVSPRVHTIATFLVAFGTTLSAFWIIVLNSWMQTPQGFEMIDGQAHATNWFAIVFNPSMPYRLAHMLTAAFITVTFLLAGISAFRQLRGSKSAANKAVLKIAITTAAILMPIQIILGDAHGLNTLQHQPAKLAAMEGIWESGSGIPAVIFAIPDQKTQSNLYEVSIPKLASFYLTHHWDGEVQGLKDFPNKIPPVAPVFFAFRIMVGMGLLMLLVSWMARWQIYKSQDIKPWMAKILVGMTFSGWIAVVAGWYVTEIGRQPYIVTGVLTTADAATTIAGGIVLSSLLMYLFLYIALIISYIGVVFYLAREGDKAPVSNTITSTSNSYAQ
ncbi:cytochrome ubiquinol oxidase subunit I [Polynucleobacter sphagniphilus]|jgi:cytochrome d ubiquinol oxidase subunit I|uniref:Cytochrome d ubiquinol oxidase subunit I n=1 Tax=Polynucleobacter sphagniphilus TaxID=1743169 RepID=A0AA43M7V0_9BURK|nr:cytochrome ubiquinol oxidase subunit I [Polynucleobacter sphagniphilus]MDF9788789.1 cytochrome d ubiquinol oxidase subunit I [Polynucleobacter sphagniphilus]MDH6248627.1 cytochrome d ubiquinol oxidase subunit I [Polynucleobacter sphagniphilus]MDH6303299.1 cytochrome d ubiquinol oxidase subunit I [Polynucleobacter sphagniphilus]MDH6503811.1 cytochrome d ubiquinol oxidase subunit I [Polynucleobacter sphagniphilus]MDH6512303.1 cytochrome d ubiquinol oxidase subunit I [Polynucleobacter sphagnip